MFQENITLTRHCGDRPHSLEAQLWKYDPRSCLQTKDPGRSEPWSFASTAPSYSEQTCLLKRCSEGLFPEGMTASLFKFTPEFDTSLSIHSFTPASYTMSSGRQEYGYRLNDSGVYDPRSNSYRTGSYSQGSNHGNRNPGPFPTSVDTTSRRRGMNIEEILNPSDEDTRPYQQPQISRSYEAETMASRNPGSLQGNRVPGSGPRSHGANASTRSRGSSRPRPRSRGSGSPEAPSRTRAFRPDYTCEEEHFIWYLRNDVRLC